MSKPESKGASLSENSTPSTNEERWCSPAFAHKSIFISKDGGYSFAPCIDSTQPFPSVVVTTPSGFQAVSSSGFVMKTEDSDDEEFPDQRDFKIISLSKPLLPEERELVSPQYQKIVDFSVIGNGCIQHDDRARLKIYSMVNEEIILEPYTCKAIKTGLYISKWYCKGCFIQLMPRMMFAEKNVSVLNGIIDRYFKGQIKVILSNHSNKTVIISPGTSIAQMIIVNFQPAIVSTQEYNTSVEGPEIAIIEDVGDRLQSQPRRKSETDNNFLDVV